MAAFDSSPGRVRVRLEPEEIAVLTSLLEEAEHVMADDADTDVKRRLFPNAYEDADDQRAYEDLIGQQLRDEKLRAVRQVRSSLGSDEIELDEESVHAWLVVVTDLRLALGTRLAVTEEVMAADLDPEDPNAPALSVLHWLGWVQESLLSHLS